MLDWIVRQYYKIPHISIRFKNLIVLRERDSRSFEWYKQRVEYGFDERLMWNLGTYLHHKICDFLKIESNDDTEHVSIEQFTMWFNNDKAGLKWISDRLCIYIKWECPTFFYDDDYRPMPDDFQQEQMRRLLATVNNKLADKEVRDEDVVFLYDNIFRLGW